MRPIVRAITAFGSGRFAAVGVTAGDTSLVKAVAGSAALAGAGGAGGGAAFSFGVSIAENRIGNVAIAGATRQHVVRAWVESSKIASALDGSGNVSAASGALTVQAT